MRRGITSLIALAAIAAGLATAPGAYAAEVDLGVTDCRNTYVGDIVDVRYCAGDSSTSGTAWVDPNPTISCAIYKPVNLNLACSYVAFADSVASSVGKTGFTRNPYFPSPTISGTNVSHPGGTVGWVYVNGVSQPVTTPPFCSGSPSFCGTAGWVLALV